MSTTFAVDLAFNTKGLNGLGKARAEMDKVTGASGKAANGIKSFSRGVGGATTATKGLGLAFQAALGPMVAAVAAIGGLTKGFEVLKNQDFAIAKLKTLGVETDTLTKNLAQVSKELNGSASVAELTGAAYDVASAGFSDAADNAKVLKAAALGAAGGFTDMNTAGNALTSVLNAYGKSADSAEKYMDQFVQTQNDGKIVVEEYARNIGKVASAAAALGVPLAEVNAAIAQSTASGVQAEVAFTGVKTALARLASGEAAKALQGTGLEIDAASVASDGLIGTLQRLKDAGLDTGQIFKALGTEAAPALLPLLNNLEKTEQLLLNQNNAAGVAAKAQQTATDTIAGAWKRLTTEFENFFVQQSSLGDAIKIIIDLAVVGFKNVAKQVEMILAPVKLSIQAFTAVYNIVKQLGDAFTTSLEQTEGFQVLQEVFARLQPSLAGISETVSSVLGPAFETLLKWAGQFAELLGGAILNGLNIVIGGIVRLGKLIPGLGDGAQALEEGWNGIKDAVANTSVAAAALPEPIEKVKNATVELVEKQKLVTNEYQKQTAALNTEMAAIKQASSLKQAELDTERLLLGIKSEQAQAQLDAATTAEERVKAAKEVYDLTVLQAKLELEAAKAASDAAYQQAVLNLENAQLKLKELEAVVNLARAQGKLTADHIAAVNAQREAVGIAKNALQVAGAIAGEQNKQADALYKSKISAAEAAFEQNRVMQATQGAASAAAQFAANMQKGASSAQAATSAMQSGSSVYGNSSGVGVMNNRYGEAGKQADFVRRFYEAQSDISDDGTFDMKQQNDLQLMYEQFDVIAAEYNRNKANERWEASEADWAKYTSEYASGGYVTGPETALVGEGGEPEYIIPESKMDSAMKRYGSGVRGENVLNGAAEVSVNYNGSSITVGGEDYIKKDDVSGIVKTAVNSTLKTISKSATARLNAGIR